MSIIGHNNPKERIAELRRERRAEIGKAKRARAAMDEMRWKAQSCDARASHLGREIEALGGKVEW